jgi:uncharacterized protein with HEPN domain
MSAKSSPSKADPESQAAYLHDMLESAQHILRYMDGISYERFWDDSEKRDAVAMRLAVIGEAAAHITEGTAARLKEVPFKEIRGMRNRIAHDYGRVDYTVVWTVTQEDMGPLVHALERHLPRQPAKATPPSGTGAVRGSTRKDPISGGAVPKRPGRQPN